MNGRSVGEPVFNNELLDADKELHLYIIVKSGLVIAVAGLSSLLGSTSIEALGRRTLLTTLQGLYEVGIVSANRNIVDRAWNSSISDNNTSYVPLYDISVGVILHGIDIYASQKIALSRDGILFDANDGINRYVEQSYKFLSIGGAVGLWLGQIIKNGIDTFDLRNGKK
jgi:hypothetical protein